MDGQHLDWYLVRATGLVAWALVSLAVVYGAVHAMSRARHQRRTRHALARLDTRVRPAWVLDLHRFLGGLACLAVAVHVGALLFDRFVGFGVADLLVPFATRYRPAALAWGIAAAYVLAAVEITSLCMHRIPRRVWHGVHLGSVLVFVAATVHALTAGTDRGAPGVRALAVVSCVSVAVALALRVATIMARPRPPHDRGDADPAARHAPTLVPTVGATGVAIDAAIDEVTGGAARSRRVARHGHHRAGVSRGTPR